MNHKPNEIEWNEGDLVIHDADAKRPHMIMKVIRKYDTPEGKMYATKYLDGGVTKKTYDNDGKYLHGLERFNITPPSDYCDWKHDEHHDCWETSCGNASVFIEGTPKENECVFCTYCGKKIREVLK